MTPKTVGACQMSCSNPRHQHAGEPQCTKTRSYKFDGEGVAIHMLKAWAVLGQALDTKKRHKDAWKLVEKQQKEGKLPSLEELEDQVVHDWTAAAASGSSGPAAKAARVR